MARKSVEKTQAITPAERKKYREHFEIHFDELKWLYTELYKDEAMFAELCNILEMNYVERPKELKKRDRIKELNPRWYKSQDQVGMMLYVDKFAGNLKGVEAHLNYLQKANAGYIHLMPFLESPKDKSDGGRAVSNFRKVKRDLGSMADLQSLTQACHKKGINVCIDFMMNHTSEDHAWAKKARSGDEEYLSRYIVYDGPDIPNQFDETVPQVYPATAPGNFSYIPELDKFVMTTFYQYEWDLNYANPKVFNEMMDNLLFLANQGVDMMRLDGISYIWKELGTACRDNPEVHSLLRMIRIITEIVCPSVVLVGEVGLEPEKAVAYFGNVEKPECQMLYNVTNMPILWHTIATRDCKLLKKQIDMLNALPRQFTFINYIRNNECIEWNLDYETLAEDHIDETAHKNYLNEFFTGIVKGSNADGVLYNDDPITQEDRIAGTTASLCGVEKAIEWSDDVLMDMALREVVMLHVFLFMMNGVPMIYSGDEIGEINDHSYLRQKDKAGDSRNVHRGKLNWENVDKIRKGHCLEHIVFSALCKLEEIRKERRAFNANADTWTMDTWDAGTIALGRYYDGEKIIGVFNFTEHDRTAWINENDGDYLELFSGRIMPASGVQVPAYTFRLLVKEFR